MYWAIRRHIMHFRLPFNSAFRFLFDTISQGACFLDDQGKIVTANPLLTRWLEVPDPSGTSMKDWLDAPSVWTPPGEFEAELKSESGIVRHVMVKADKVCDDNGEFVGYGCLFSDQSMVKALEGRLVAELQRMAKLAGEDPLTGVANRRAFDETLAHLTQADERKFGVVLADLDDFKQINDSFGHTVGDDVLVAFAKKLQLLVREGDLVARIGGDEFAVLMPNVTIVGLTEAANRLRESLFAELESKGKVLRVSASIGYAHSGPEPKSVVQRADHWMYTHKNVRESAGISGMATSEGEVSRRVV